MVPKSGNRFSEKTMRDPNKTDASDEALVELFLDMQAAERGAGENTLSAYRNDLADLAAYLHAQGVTIFGADTQA
jgi:integrase/recombinase XerD